jgi:hypothetical protein
MAEEGVGRQSRARGHREMRATIDET